MCIRDREEAYLYTLTADVAKAELVLWYAFRCAGAPQGYTVRAEGVCGDSRFSVSAKAWSTAGNVRICVPSVSYTHLDVYKRQV